MCIRGDRFFNYLLQFINININIHNIQQYATTIKREYLNIKTFLQKFTFQIGTKKFLLLKLIKNTMT